MLVLFGPGRMAVLKWWLPYTVTIIDRLHCANVNIDCSAIPMSAGVPLDSVLLGD